MDILAKAMGEHLAQCAAAGYNAPQSAPCSFVPPAANHAWAIGRYLHEHGMPLPRSIDAVGGGMYKVDGVALRVGSSDLVQLLQ